MLGFVVSALLLLSAVIIPLAAANAPEAVQRKLDAYVAFWPQEWSFFVALDTDILSGYRVQDGDGPMTPLYVSDNDSRDLGFDRGSYRLSSEIREIGLKVPDRYWRACDRFDAAECGPVLDLSLVHRMPPLAREPLLCGLLVVAVQRITVPPPRALPDERSGSHRLAVVDVECRG